MANEEYLLGNLLVKKKLIDFSQLSKAVEYQSKLNPIDYLPIGEVLVKLGYITFEDLEEVLREQKILKYGASGPNTRIQSNLNSPNTSTLKNDVNNIVENNPTSKPRAAVPISFINRSQNFFDSKENKTNQPPPPKIDRNTTIPIKPLPIQPPPPKKEQPKELILKVTEIASKMGLLSKEELIKTLKQSQSIGQSETSVGALLVQHGFITKEQLEQIMKEIK